MSATLTTAHQAAAATGTLLFSASTWNNWLSVGASYVLQGVADAKAEIATVETTHPIVAEAAALVLASARKNPEFAALEVPAEKAADAVLGLARLLAHVNDAVAAGTPAQSGPDVSGSPVVGATA